MVISIDDYVIFLVTYRTENLNKLDQIQVFTIFFLGLKYPTPNK